MISCVVRCKLLVEYTRDSSAGDCIAGQTVISNSRDVKRVQGIRLDFR